jgi:hypothetical protein
VQSIAPTRQYGSSAVLDQFRTAVDRLGCKSRPGNGRDQFYGFCPCHDDRHPSFTFGIGKKGQIVFQCHANCILSIDKAELLQRIGWEWKDLRPDSRELLSDAELYARYKAGEIKPDPAGIMAHLPEDAPPAVRQVAQDMELRKGLRLQDGRDDEFPYPCREAALRLGWEAKDERRVCRALHWLRQRNVIRATGKTRIQGRAEPAILYQPIHQNPSSIRTCIRNLGGDTAIKDAVSCSNKKRSHVYDALPPDHGSYSNEEEQEEVHVWDLPQSRASSSQENFGGSPAPEPCSHHLQAWFWAYTDVTKPRWQCSECYPPNPRDESVRWLAPEVRHLDRVEQPRGPVLVESAPGSIALDSVRELGFKLAEDVGMDDAESAGRGRSWWRRIP